MASPFNRSNLIRFRPRDRQTMVVVEFTDGSRAYVRVDPHTATMGGEPLLLALRERQAHEDAPAGAPAHLCRSANRWLELRSPSHHGAVVESVKVSVFE